MKRNDMNLYWGLWWIAVAVFFIGAVCCLPGRGSKAEAERVSRGKEPVIRETYVEEVTFTGETEAMVFGSAAPEIVDIAVEKVETEKQETKAKIVRNDEGTKGDLELLALVIYQEAGGDMCSDETRRMVGEVVLNRVKDKRYPCTIEGVITQQGQYGLLYKTGPVWPKRAENPGEQHAVERAYETAWALLIDDVDRLLPEDVIYQAEFVQGKETVAEADGFYFCR